MQIRIPIWLTIGAQRLGTWANAPVWQSTDIRRLDLLLVICFAVCVGWYYLWYGWRGALLGGAVYVWTAMAALWLRGDDSEPR